MKRGSVVVGVVDPGDWRGSFGVSLLETFVRDSYTTRRILGYRRVLCGTDGLVAARNAVAEHALSTDAEWLWIVDTDMGFADDTLDRLIEAADRYTRPVMGALCFGQHETHVDGPTRERVYQPFPTLYGYRSTEDFTGFPCIYDYPRNEVVRVAGTGAACLLIHRSALHKIHKAHGPTWFQRAPKPGQPGKFWSEDLSFCLRLAAADIPLHVHTGIKTSHDKHGVYLTEALYDRLRQPQATGLPDMVEGARDVISLLCPSRGRAGQLAEMWDSAKANADRPDLLELVVRLDDDDPQDHIDDATVIIGPRGLLSAYWNECCEKASGQILMHCGDDIRFRTPRWDSKIRAAFDQSPDRILFVHGDDGFQHGRLGTHGFLSREWVETVGYFVPPMFSSDFNDTWLTEVADRIGRRRYLPDVVTEHLHPAAGKGEWDRTHQERLERHREDRPDVLYENTRAEREADAAKLKAVMA